ncbi:3'(2'),5'-bisphosphate nucleotidase CysQ [Endozoicomonas sp. SM1973]|uniref:3'(2'),5'-bisphosphate nucleotidase CysQ n=1 Tax=Spartinivicinus marinus TaxID=2994442 RepID=A0A853IA00_9GAMM|nr:3'(2'),5'-bisphosphate nucleotidase CysQ [Spartinivicinus marinus]MCX4027194.1 3'(2'),5'-bisphosphate nucleotidase CysQ [Spartinivicinus marinus]NYZ66085.1 3'(2'),5'-bisphosphate nucleotidase CysQ [Spartinivicinus marinus]
MKLLIEPLLLICQQAGKAIMDVYQQPDFQQWQKQDQSPVTAADYASHQIIIQGLQQLADQYPILSEESATIPFNQRQQWSRYWLVDPLDGTKEFIKHNDEFTINIALIEDHRPILGMLYVPVTGECYAGGENLPPMHWTPENLSWQPLTTYSQDSQTLSILMSRSHLSAKDQQLLDNLKQEFSVNVVHAGSAIKFSWLVTGKANLYCRFTPTSEWDTAAGQAIVESAGGIMLSSSGQPFTYNQQESLINGPFLVTTLTGSSFEVLNKIFQQAI